KAWTSEIGARASAARCSRKPVTPSSRPTRHQGERSIEASVRSGRRTLTGGRSEASSCWHRYPEPWASDAERASPRPISRAGISAAPAAGEPAAGEAEGKAHGIRPGGEVVRTPEELRLDWDAQGAQLRREGPLLDAERIRAADVEQDVKRVGGQPRAERIDVGRGTRGAELRGRRAGKRSGRRLGEVARPA